MQDVSPEDGDSTQTLDLPTDPTSQRRASSRLSAGRMLGAYEIVRCIGTGSSSRVYEAIDHDRTGLRVALKVLLDQSARALLRLKREFRSLADVHDANLVRLHGLFNHGGYWFVVMDLIHGQDFLSYVRPEGARTCSEARLRDAIAQLVRGISAIHAAGKLHRDLKPSNVLVNGDGRIVLVDFGLVLDLGARGSAVVDHNFVGTPAYAAPEQATRGSEVSPASDMYAIGVMLYQALTGRLPFTGDTAAVLARKQREDAALPADSTEPPPADLSALCLALLARDPRARPEPAEVLARLG